MYQARCAFLLSQPFRSTQLLSSAVVVLCCRPCITTVSSNVQTTEHRGRYGADFSNHSRPQSSSSKSCFRVSHPLKSTQPCTRTSITSCITCSLHHPLHAFIPPDVRVCVGMFPISGADFDTLNAEVERLTLNDASVSVKRENSAALGAGFRCGSVLPFLLSCWGSTSFDKFRRV